VRIFLGIAVFLASLAPLRAQYGGPAVLTRGQAPVAMAPSQIDFRPFLSIDAGYDTGLNGVSVDPNGKTPNLHSTAVAAAAGISGFHSWKHTTLGLDYRASFRHYDTQSYYDGTDQLLLLSLTHMLSRHVMFSLREDAGLYSQNYAAPSLLQTVPFDPATAYVPTADFFDNRTMYFSTQLDLQVQLSTRLSFDVGADGFLTRRRSTALYGVKGAGARGDLQYRLSRRTTIGLGYTYTHYAFHGIFSSTDLHSLVASYAVRLSRTVELSATGGAMRFENKFVQNVPIDPAIAAVICVPGQPCGSTQVVYGVSYIPNITARLSKVVPRGVVFVTGGQSVTPGNGLFLTSKSLILGGGYSYTGLKKWAISSALNYSSSKSEGNVIGNYNSIVASASVSRQIFRGTHGMFTFSARQYGSGDFKNYNKWAYSIRAGLGFTPGDIPIRLW
jgi:hypothetical protein